MTTVLAIDPHHPTLSLLTPLFAQRVREYAEKHQPEVDPVEFTGAVMARLWQRDANLAALGMITADGKLVGHALAVVEGPANRRVAAIYQLRADANVGNARRDAIQRVTEWAKVHKVNHLVWHTNRESKDWADLGFRPFMHLGYFKL